MPRLCYIESNGKYNANGEIGALTHIVHNVCKFCFNKTSLLCKNLVLGVMFI